MDATGDYHTKWNQKENDNDITYMWNFKYDTNEPICETETESPDKENRFVVTKGWVRAGVGGWDQQMKAFTI